MMTRWCIVLLVLSVAALPGTAVARGSKSDDDLAKQYYKLGEKLYNRSDYEGALKQFEKAYEASPRAPFIYNMARCHEFMGQLEQAIKRYQEFLTSKPPNAAVIEARIANLKQRLKKQQASKASPPPATPPAGTATAGQQPPAQPAPPAGQQPPAQPTSPATTTAQPTPPPASPATPPPAPARSRWKRTTGWILIGAGGLSLVASLVAGLRAKSLSDELNQGAEDGEPWADYRDKVDQGEQMEKLQWATLGLGAALAAGGALLLYLDQREKRPARRAWISPTLTAGGAMVSGTVHF